MAIPPETVVQSEERRSLALIGLAALGPTLWFFDLVVAYAVSTHECGGGLARISIALTALSALGTTGALWGTARMRAQLEESPRATRSRELGFLIQASYMLNALALLLLFGFAAPLSLLRPCE